MRIISTREFRDHQKNFLELAEKERVIIHRGKNRKPMLLTPIDESTESDIYFSDPKVIASIVKGIEDMKHGRAENVKLSQISKLLGLTEDE